MRPDADTLNQNVESAISVAVGGLVRLAGWAFQRVLIYSSAWVAGGLAALTLFTAHVLDLRVPWEAPGLVFCSALFVYNLDHVIDSRVQAIPDHEAQRYFRNPLVLILLVASAITTGWLVHVAPAPARWVFAAYTVTGLGYGLPIVPWPSRGGLRWRRIKEIAGAKGWLVTFALTFAVVGLPLAWTGRGLDRAAWEVAVFTYAYICTNAHMFDIRDMESDTDSGVSTLPTQIGVRRTKLLLVLMNLVILAAMCWGWAGSLVARHPEILLCFMASIAYVYLVDTRSPRSAYSIAIDGTLYLPAALVSLHHVFG